MCCWTGSSTHLQNVSCKVKLSFFGLCKDYVSSQNADQNNRPISYLPVTAKSKTSRSCVLKHQTAFLLSLRWTCQTHLDRPAMMKPLLGATRHVLKVIVLWSKLVNGNNKWISKWINNQLNDLKNLINHLLVKERWSWQEDGRRPRVSWIKRDKTTCRWSLSPWRAGYLWGQTRGEISHSFIWSS